MQWGPVIAGVLCAIAAHIVLGLFGAAFGFAAAPTSSKGLGVGAGVWGLLTPFVASLIGAWVAVRVAGDREEAGAMLHGAVVWSIGLIAGAIFLTGVLSSGAMTSGAAAAGNVGARAVERHDTPQSRARTQEAAGDVARGAAAGSGLAGVAALLGLAGAAAGATLGRRMVRGDGLRRRQPATASEHHPLPDTGVAYTTREGYVTTRPPIDVTDADEGPHQRH